MRRVVRDVRIVDADGSLSSADIWIENGVISDIDRGGGVGAIASVEEVDGKGWLCLPGVVDPHVHFNTPGFVWREDFFHGSRAAAAGGVTTVVEMPCISLPPATTLDYLNTKLESISSMACVDFALWAGVSHQSMTEGWWMDEMERLWGAGVVGFKVYEISGMDYFSALSVIELGQVLQYASSLGALVGVHAEDPDVVREREAERRAVGGDDIWDYYYSRSEPAEEKGVALACQIAKQTGARLHVVHVGSGAAVKVLRRYKDEGVDVSAETCPHFLAFTCADFARYGSLLKTAPVVKTSKDRSELWDALADGTIDLVSTDHAPCPVRDKRTGSVWTDYGGLPHVEVLLPYIFSEGYKKGRLDLARLVEITSTNPAKRLGLYPKKGCIAPGSDADFVLVDPEGTMLVDAASFYSKGKFSPFDGSRFVGRIKKVFVRGKTVYEDGIGVVVKGGYGKWVKRHV